MGPTTTRANVAGLALGEPRATHICHPHTRIAQQNPLNLKGHAACATMLYRLVCSVAVLNDMRQSAAVGVNARVVNLGMTSAITRRAQGRKVAQNFFAISSPDPLVHIHL